MVSWRSVIGTCEEVLASTEGEAVPLALHALSLPSSELRNLPTIVDASLRARLCSVLERLAEQITRLCTFLDASLDGSDGTPAQQQRHNVPASILGVSLTCSQAGVVLVKASQLEERKPLYSMAAATASLVLGPGARMLALAGAQHAHGAARAGTPHPGPVLTGQLSVWLAFLHQPGLELAAAALARTAAKPAALLPWLLTSAAELLRHLPAVPGTAPPSDVVDWLRDFLAVVTCTVCTLAPDAFAAHGSAAAGDAELQRHLLEVALLAMEVVQQQQQQQQQGSDSHGSNRAVVVQNALAVTNDPAFAGALVKLVQQGGAVSALSAASAALRLPLPADGAQQALRKRAIGAALSLAGRVAREVQVTTPLMPQLRPAAWAVMRLLPQAATAARLMLASEPEEQLVEVEGLAVILSLLTDLVRQPPSPFFGSNGEAADWCGAADACLRLLPPLLAAQQRWQRVAVPSLVLPPGSTSGFVLLAEGALVLLARLTDLADFNRMHTGTYAGQQAAVATQAEALWRVHTTALRLVHFAAADDAQLGVLQAIYGWRGVHTSVHTVFKEAMEINRIGLGLADAPEAEPQRAAIARRMQAMALAHARVVPVLAARRGVPFDTVDEGFYTELLHIVAAAPHAALDPAIVPAFERCARGAWQAARHRRDPNNVWTAVEKTVGKAEEWPRYAAYLLRSGLMAEGLRAAEQAAAAAGAMPSPGVARQLLGTVMNSCTSLGRTAAEVQLPSGGDARGTRAREDCEALREASLVCGVLLDARTAPQLRWLPVWQSQLLPAATAVAQLLEQHWAEPEQVKAARLATAQAASTRSCAFLRCTNLAGEAGAGAGEGAGSMRCSGCKRTWYCGTQCSHADWANNGHRRVCKLLAAARQAERQRQRQAGQ